MVKNTLILFRIILQNIPPFFPKNIALQMESALEQLENDVRITPKMVEDVMIKFGYDLWPWNEAYKEFLATTEGRLGEQFLLSRLPQEIIENYLKYSDYGLTWQDLYTGKAAQYFSFEERPFLTLALEQTKKDLIQFTNQEIKSINKEKYLRKVNDFKRILEKIKSIVKNLKDMAEAEEYFPVLAHEMKEKARNFELSLCLLAPNFILEETLNSIEFFQERKLYLNSLKGIEKPISIDFYEK